MGPSPEKRPPVPGLFNGLTLYMHYCIYSYDYQPKAAGPGYENRMAEETVASEEASLSLEIIQDAARVLKCIGHPLRLRIIELLDASDEMNVGSICSALDLEQAIASQHLTLMRDRGILASRRDGVNVYYRIADEKVPQVIDCLRRCDR